MGRMDDDKTPKPKGRPPLPDDVRRDQTIRVRATAQEVETFEALGGADWFRQALARAAAALRRRK